MSFRPEPLGRAPSPGSPGHVDYRLARSAVIREYRRGRLSRGDLCDAHPELLRVARSLGQPTGEPCPVCEEDCLVHVSFVFGPRMPPGGHCVGSRAEMARLGSGSTALACYVVEVCQECSWNHLSRMEWLGGRARHSDL